MTKNDHCDGCIGYCCTILRLFVSEADILKVSAYLNMPIEDIKSLWLLKTPQIEGKFDTIRPCPFWQTGRCGVYAARPENCAAFGPLPIKEGCKNWLQGVFKLFGVVNLW